MTDAQQQVPGQPETPDLKSILKDYPDAPNDTDIEKWKQQFGEVFTSGFSEEELFVWHPLSRADYLELQKKTRVMPQQGEQQSDFDFEKAVIDTCLLWAADKTVFERKGGSIPTLSEQIMMNSNFMNPAMASMLVMKL